MRVSTIFLSGLRRRLEGRLLRWLRQFRPLRCHPRSAVLACWSLAMLGALAGRLFADRGPAWDTLAVAATLLGAACGIDNLWNLLTRSREQEARTRALETAWLEAHIELGLLRVRLLDHGLDIGTRRLASAELHRQLSLPSPPGAEDGTAGGSGPLFSA